jgi:predicted AlkP superfamily phosphohydrolase/phosphomutase
MKGKQEIKMIKKLILIGVDGMDYDVVMKYSKFLPNLRRMIEPHGNPRLRSVFPADTTPAWATIFTGLDPSEHGIINFVNIGDKENKYKPIIFDDSAFKGRTFWDRLNEAGYSCTVLFPMNVKIGWDINGLMITRPYEGIMRVYPSEKESLYTPNNQIMGSDAKYTSEKQLGRLRDEFFMKAEEEFRITRLALENEDSDLLFTYFSTVDGVQHEFWRHCNENHPEYPGENDYKNVIRDMYVKIDEYIGEIIGLCPNTPILLISDHGHGARPVYIARINEMLRRFGYLTPRSSESDGRGTKSSRVKKLLKKYAMGFVKRYGLPKWAVKIAKKFPVWKGLFASGSDFDWSRTQAYLSDLSALKNYSYGGIRLQANVKNKTMLCDEIITKLSKVEIPGEDKPLFSWIRRVDTLYHGEFIDKYPEIIFQMDESYGADWSLGETLFEKSGFMHRLSPGSHRYETAVIAARGFTLEKAQYEMTDIYDLVISLTTG